MELNRQELYEKAMEKCSPLFETLKTVSLHNTEKVLTAFRESKLSAFHFAPSNGYGYGDPGREKLEEVWNRVFHAQASLVRPQFVSGTHALATVLLALLDRGDEMVSVTGTPYDTMQSVIGISGGAPHNLMERGVSYRDIPMKNGRCDMEAISHGIHKNTSLVLIQRSRGYAERRALLPEDIRAVIQCVKNQNPNTICFVDNCYGEFTCTEEPIELGADITAGSLIKNAGGGLAPTGGYICGREDLVDRCAQEWTAPGLGGEMGSYAGGYRAFFQGLFMAPHIVRQAVMSAEFTAAVFELMGFNVSPVPGSQRSDLITAVELGSEKNMRLFAEALQNWSPVDSFVTPVPGPMPGYTDLILMAAGTFVQGSTIELSADGPVRAPYTIYIQGGMVFEHTILAVLGAAEKIMEDRL